MDKVSLSARIKELALEVGFDACGIAKVEDLSEEREILNQWLAKKYHGDMTYMERNIEKRTNPSELIGGAKSLTRRSSPLAIRGVPLLLRAISTAA